MPDLRWISTTTPPTVPGRSGYPDRRAAEYRHDLTWSEQQPRTRPRALANKQVRQAIQYGIDYDGIRRWVDARPRGTTALADRARHARRRSGAGGAAGRGPGRAVPGRRGPWSNVGFPLWYPTQPFGSVDPAVLAAKIQADLAEIGITVELDPVEQERLLVPKPSPAHCRPYIS